MSLVSSEMTPADIAAVCGNRNNNCGGMFGGDWSWILILFLFGFLGWGGAGFGGGFGGGWGGMNGGVGSEIQRGFDFNNIIRKLDEQTYGIADATFALNNSITSGFSSAELSRCNQQAALMAQLCSMAADSAKCCCDTQRLIERTAADTNYNLANQFCETRHQASDNTRDIVDSQNAGTRAILEKLGQIEYNQLAEKNRTLENENQNLKQNAYIAATIEASQATLLRRLGAECPQAAYIVQPPTTVSFPTNCCGQAQFGGWGNGWGNNCGCRASA